MKATRQNSGGIVSTATSAAIAMCLLILGRGSAGAYGGELAFRATAENELRHVEFSSDGKLLASSGPAKNVLVWDTSSWKRIRALEPSTPVFAFVPGESTLICISEDGAIFWDLAAATPKMRREPLKDRGNLIAVAKDGKTVATGLLPTRSAGFDIEILGVADLKRRAVLKASWHIPDALVFSPDGKRLAQSSIYSDDVLVWQIGVDEKPRALRLPEHGCTSVAFSPDSTFVAASNGYKGNDGSVVLWDVRSPDEPQVLESTATTIWSLAFAHDGSSLFAGADANVDGSQTAAVIIWDLKTKKSQRRLIQDKKAVAVYEIALSPDGQTLALACYDGALRILQVSDLTRLLNDN